MNQNDNAYSDRDLQSAEKLREAIHQEALARVKSLYPAADCVIDRYPVEAYFQQVWDYPGQWYTVVAIPHGFGSRKALVDSIVRETLEHYRRAGAKNNDDVFYRLLAEYPDNICDYCIVTASDRQAEAEAVFPYRGAESHWLALGCAARKLFAESRKWAYDMSQARCKKQSNKSLFAPANSVEGLNYRKAFLRFPHGNTHTDEDFDRLNAVLFPGGEDGLEVRKWNTDWSDYFAAGQERWGTLCLTVYDKGLDRFVAIMASATD